MRVVRATNAPALPKATANPILFSHMVSKQDRTRPGVMARAIIGADEIRSTLQRILSEASFQRSPQLRAFLTYVVEEALAGRGSLLKSYSIATEALGRPDDFDPATDAIVRVEAKRLRQVLGRIYAGPACDLPVRIEIPVGRYEPIFSLIEPVVDKDEEAGRSRWGVSDLDRLSRRSKQAQALIRSEERYRALVQASAAVEWRADAAGRITHSLGWIERTGQNARDFESDGWLEAVHPEDRERVERAWRHASLTGEKVEMSLRVRHRDGAYRWLFARGVPVENSDGSIREWIGTFTDIHDHMKAVETLRASEAKLRLVMDAARLVAFELDPVTGIVTWSENSWSLLGIGSGPASQFHGLIDPEDRARVAAAIDASIENGTPFAQTFRVVRPDGTVVRVLARGSMVRGQMPSGDRFVGIVTDTDFGQPW